MSIIWQFFTVEDQADEIAKCCLCLKGIRRGKVGCLPRNFSTTPLHKHMKSVHATEYSQTQEKALLDDKLRKCSTNQTAPKQGKLAKLHWKKFSAKRSIGKLMTNVQ